MFNDLKVELKIGIIEIDFPKEIDLKIATFYSQCLGYISLEKNYPILMNFKSVLYSTKESRDLMARIGHNGPKAILVDSPINSMIANFFMRISAPHLNIRIFNSKEKAVLWLTNHNVGINTVRHSNFKSYEEAMNRLLFLKRLIEHRDGYKAFKGAGSGSKEELLHFFYSATWFETDFDVNREVGNGRGFVDFKISKGSNDSTLVEFKLASNSGIQHVRKQVEIYEEANDTKSSIIAIIFFSDEEEEKIKNLGFIDNNNIILIDAKPNNKISGSKVKYIKSPAGDKLKRF